MLHVHSRRCCVGLTRQISVSRNKRGCVYTVHRAYDKELNNFIRGTKKKWGQRNAVSCSGKELIRVLCCTFEASVTYNDRYQPNGMCIAYESEEFPAFKVCETSKQLKNVRKEKRKSRLVLQQCFRVFRYMHSTQRWRQSSMLTMANEDMLYSIFIRSMYNVCVTCVGWWKAGTQDADERTEGRGRERWRANDYYYYHCCCYYQTKTKNEILGNGAQSSDFYHCLFALFRLFIHCTEYTAQYVIRVSGSGVSDDDFSHCWHCWHYSTNSTHTHTFPFRLFSCCSCVLFTQSLIWLTNFFSALLFHVFDIIGHAEQLLRTVVRLSFVFAFSLSHSCNLFQYFSRNKSEHKKHES